MDKLLTRLSQQDLTLEGGALLPDKEVLSILDLFVNLDIAIDLAAPVDLAIAANANVAAPIDAAATEAHTASPLRTPTIRVWTPCQSKTP